MKTNLNLKKHSITQMTDERTRERNHKSTTSYGLIIARKDDDGHVRFVVMERQNTYSYLEFLRGKYFLKSNFDPQENKSNLNILLSRMTRNERTLVKSMTIGNYDRHVRDVFITEARHRKNRLDYARNSFKNAPILSTLNMTESHYDRCEIGFPKGKRNKKETSINCALREFNEETGIPLSEIKLFDPEGISIDEINNATNNIRYKSIYFLGVLTSHRTEFILGPKQLEESRCVFMSTIEDLQNIHFREYETYKRSTLIKAIDMFERYKILDGD